MKRSKMVHLIHDLVSETLCTREEFNLNDCDRLLSAIEDVGILPPLRDRTEHEREIFGTKEDDFDMSLKKRKWDEE